MILHRCVGFVFQASGFSFLGSLRSHPASTHLHSPFPLCKLSRTLLSQDLGLKDRTAGTIDISQLGKVVPKSNSKAGCNGCTESCSLTHLWAVDGDGYHICLSLYFNQISSCSNTHTCKRICYLPALLGLSYSYPHLQPVPRVYGRCLSPLRLELL